MSALQITTIGVLYPEIETHALPSCVANLRCDLKAHVAVNHSREPSQRSDPGPVIEQMDVRLERERCRRVSESALHRANVVGFGSHDRPVRVAQEVVAAV